MKRKKAANYSENDRSQDDGRLILSPGSFPFWQVDVGETEETVVDGLCWSGNHPIGLTENRFGVLDDKVRAILKVPIDRDYGAVKNGIKHVHID